MSAIRVVIVEPDQPARAVEIDDGLSSLQAAVGGWLEAVRIEDGYIALVNENGRLNGLPFCCVLGGHDLVGTVIITKPRADGEFQSLTAEEAERWTALLD